jgi:pyridoxal phosphate enzyme (YggS family)
MNRKSELAANLHEVQTEIARLCAGLGRELPTVIVVTKTWPASDIELLAELDVKDVGENRDQEASPKQSELEELDLTWHAIGQLQTNKAKSVAQWADVLHSVDRPDLVNALAKVVGSRLKPLKVLIQVNLDPNPSDLRGGCLPALALELAELISQTNGLELKGVMGVAPLAGDDRQAFAKLARVAAEIQEFDPSANWISAGMSGDYPVALENGATHLRIGSTILGHRTK